MLARKGFFLRAAGGIALAFAVVAALTGCVSRGIDTRSLEQRLASRPQVNFSAEEVAEFQNADRTKPIRLSVRRQIFSTCVPDSLPVRAMQRENATRVEGTIVATATTAGYFESVRAVNVVPETLTLDVEELFRPWLTPPCKLPPLNSPLQIEIPLVLRLE